MVHILYGYVAVLNCFRFWFHRLLSELQGPLSEVLPDDLGRDLVNFLGSRPFFYSDRVSRADLAVYSFLHYIPETAGPVKAIVDSRRPLVDLMARVEAAVRS